MTSTQNYQCALPECENPITYGPSDRRRREYCSNACRQKAYRRRHQAAASRNGEFVTFWDQAMNAIRNMDMTQRRQLRRELDKQLGERRPQAAPVPVAKTLTVDELQERGEDIVYYRLRRGVVHLGFPNQSLTLCLRETTKMTDGRTLPRAAKVCQQCQKAGYSLWVEPKGKSRI